MHTAVFEQGGPVSRTVTGIDAHNDKGYTSGTPDSGNMARSGIAGDYHGSQFKKEKTNGEIHGAEV